MTGTTLTRTTQYGVYSYTTLQAAGHLGQEKMENLRFTKNQPMKSVQQLFQATEKLIEDQKEISKLTSIDYKELFLTNLLCDKASCDNECQTLRLRRLGAGEYER